MSRRSARAYGIVMRQLRDAPILVKSLVAPLLGALITAAIVAVAAMHFLAIQAADARAEQVAHLNIRVNRASLDMTIAHATLYRAITHKAQGVEPSIVRKVRDDAAASLSAAETTLHELNAVDLPFDAALMQHVIDAFDSYLAVARTTIDIVDVDEFTAMLFMQTAEPKYADALAAIGEVASSLTTARNELEVSAQQSFVRASIEIGAGALVAVILAVGCAAFFAHLISHPVRLMTKVMTRLAGGDHSIEIPATQQRDEIGAMGRAVEVFKKNDRQLRRTQQHLTRAQAIALLGSFEHDLGTAKSVWSAENYTIIGHTPETLAASTANILSCVHEADRAVLRRFIDELREHREPAGVEIRIARPDGTIRIGRVEGQLVRDDGDTVTGYIGTMQDITERRRLEETGRALEAQLHHSQRLEALGTLAGGIAHDLNNTLVPILGLIDLTAEGLPAGSRERANLDVIADAARRARSLVNQILAFSRKDHGEHRVFDFAQLVREALALLRSAIPSTILVEQSIGDVPPMAGDDGQFHQVIVNLITNASQAIGHGIGTITVSLRSLPGPDDLPIIRLTVTDTGCGMDETTRLRVFEPFFTTRAVNEGTGLGLSIIHGIVTAHGGTIRVTSEPGQGSTFEMDLAIAGENQGDGAAITTAARLAVLAA
jgi:PAS domain S-box-containing protein